MPLTYNPPAGTAYANNTPVDKGDMRVHLSQIKDGVDANTTAINAEAALRTTADNAEIAARQRGLRDAGVQTLANVAGTANAITATRQAQMITDDIQIGGSSMVELIPAATNTGAVTLAVDGGSAEPVLRRNGAAMAAGDLMSGVSYLLRRRGATWRLAGLTDSEVENKVALETLGRNAAIDARVTPLEGPIRPVWDYVRVCCQFNTNSSQFSAERSSSGRSERTPLVESGSAVQLEVLSL